MYKIVVSYETGDSFGREDVEKDLDMRWANLDIAKENLKRIKEHYALYQRHDYLTIPNKITDETRNEFLEKTGLAKMPSWIQSYWMYSLLLLKDDGTSYEEHTPVDWLFRDFVRCRY